jgi:hypothetical protein
MDFHIVGHMACAPTVDHSANPQKQDIFLLQHYATQKGGAQESTGLLPEKAEEIEAGGQAEPNPALPKGKQRRRPRTPEEEGGLAIPTLPQSTYMLVY